jgi:hypothetical protein
MSLLDHFRAAGPDRRFAAAAVRAARGFDYVEVPAGADQGARRLDKPGFDALPLEERIGLLVQGTLRFYRGDREVPASEAMRAPY